MNRRPRKPSIEALQLQVFNWNERYPIPMEVDYHPVIGEAACERFRTCSRAFILSGHTACIFLEGKSGCVALDACEPVETVVSKKGVAVA